MSDDVAANTHLRALRESLGFKTASQFYEEHKSQLERNGISLTLYRSIENGHRRASENAARVLAKLFTSLGKHLKASDLRPRAIDEDVDVSSFVPIDAEIKMGRWQNLALDDGPLKTFQKLQAIPHVRGAAGRRALHILDESINRYAAKGDYVIYKPLTGELGDLAQYDGELLFVEIVISDLVERTVRLATLQKDGTLKLTGHSTIAKFAANPARYPCKKGAISIRGIVVAQYHEGGARTLSTEK